MSDTYSFTLSTPDNRPCRLAAGWLTLGIAALLTAGIFSILLVMARTPYLKDIFPWNDFFGTAMVVHVNLSVLMWFLPCAGLIWSFNSSSRHLRFGWLALALAALGAALVALSPFGAGTAVMNNYFPVIENSVFFTGLIMFGAGFALLAVRGLIASVPLRAWNEDTAGLSFGAYAAAIAAAIAIIMLVWAYFAIPETITGQLYYELLFWGPGHLLQFTHTLLMLVGWLWLASASGMRLPLSPRATSIIFGLGVAPVFLASWIFLTRDITSLEYTQWATRIMWVGGGLAALPLGAVVVLAMLSGSAPQPRVRPLRISLIYSIILFGMGGIFGYLIQGNSTLTTAHYHGSNGAVTMAFMGLCYLLLPRLGFQKPVTRLANIQAHAFGVGQLLHILGLAWAGGYGMPRKVAGSGQLLDNIQQIAGMTLMGIGGLIAVVGGVLFLIVVIRAMWRRPDYERIAE
jgi:hypothetical protein